MVLFSFVLFTLGYLAIASRFIPSMIVNKMLSRLVALPITVTP